MMEKNEHTSHDRYWISNLLIFDTNSNPNEVSSICDQIERDEGLLKKENKINSNYEKVLLVIRTSSIRCMSAAVCIQISITSHLHNETVYIYVFPIFFSSYLILNIKSCVQ